LGSKQASWYRIPELSNEIKHTFFWCPLIIKTEAGFSTQDIIERLYKNGIEVRQRYQAPLYRQKVLQDATPYPNGCPFVCQSKSNLQDYKTLYLPAAEALAGNIIGLPNHPELSKDDLKYIVESVLGLY